MGSNFFRGTSLDQDPRFKDKQSALLRKTHFPPAFDTKVDMRKVEMGVMKPWITKKVIELLGFEDDVLIEYIYSLLEDPENPVVDGKNMQILLTGFLESKTAAFMNHLWNLLLSAQSNPLRVPTELLEEKKREMREREQQEALRMKQEERMDEVRKSERENRRVMRAIEEVVVDEEALEDRPETQAMVLVPVEEEATVTTTATDALPLAVNQESELKEKLLRKKIEASRRSSEK
ncbi:hypothetical protein Rt10032_c03g1337 [Rhodotorula toruloides]|uniref:PWI domain-containing protein n=1 Tax=Rhodotorula toruloides TaxID=5286 RepID=A0A511KAD5_RHOTO|nr:hypothetical protein Rt10032_c03g1337 [Rhodotorula toruloides]